MVAWTKNGVPQGQQMVTPPPVSVEREESSSSGWAAVGNWSAGQDQADITVEL